MILSRATGFVSAEVLVPPAGLLPPTALPRPERVLHVALDSHNEKQPSLCAALASLGFYRHHDWLESERQGTLVRDLLRHAREHRPTLVFMQLQRQSAVTGEVVRQLKADVPEATVINWDGDMYDEPGDAAREWFVELGCACDASLVVGTHHPAQYAALGVRGPGYLQIGVDERYFREDGALTPDLTVPDVVLLAGNYPHIGGYARRAEVVGHLSEALGPERFGVYGNGWAGPCARRFLQQDEEPPVYRAARAAISISRLRDAPRYSSDRLFRAMASGAVVLVEEFPEMRTLGLVDNENCLVWDTHEGLMDLIVATGTTRVPSPFIREAARATARELHTWAARMSELAAILEVVRRSK